ncbi:MAG: leucyl aminopeptidase family protein [Proteobacteria bacterium]|nr:leucyl aminopeptidase family protein [Pseudomonadota bacterium]
MATIQSRRKAGSKVNAKVDARMPPKNIKSESRPQDSHGIFGYHRSSTLLSHFDIVPYRKSPTKDTSIDGELHVFGSKISSNELQRDMEASILGGDLEAWQLALLDQRQLEVLFLQAKRGPIWVCRPKTGKNLKMASGSGEASPYSLLRDRVGSIWGSLKDAPGVKHFGIFFHGCTPEEMMGALVGLEMASYKFTSIMKGHSTKPNFKVSVFGPNESILRAAQSMGQSINVSRHLVNLDATKLNPKSYALAIRQWFHGVKGVEVHIWDFERLKKENMNLLNAVGQAAVEKSHMVQISYRPTHSKPKFKQPIAIVGKGVTFDSGGLDIKPPSGMRHMKKDMGGSACVVGIANWLAASESDVACELYLGLAENSVDSQSFHPGDVIVARSGLSVEIHNTDAEGRLVLADVMDVAQTQSEKPCLLIDLATLTGAMRVAVGIDISGFFSNRDHLADIAYAKGFETGDPCWRLPLWEGYRSHLKSSFADLANASDSGFAGAITAALFLQRFVKKDMPWLHFDMNAWSDRPQGGLTDVGGNGQGVQLIAAFLDELKSKDL